MIWIALSLSVVQVPRAVTCHNSWGTLFNIYSTNTAPMELAVWQPCWFPALLFILRSRVRINLVSSLLPILGLPPDGDLQQLSLTFKLLLHSRVWFLVVSVLVLLHDQNILICFPTPPQYKQIIKSAFKIESNCSWQVKKKTKKPLKNLLFQLLGTYPEDLSAIISKRNKQHMSKIIHWGIIYCSRILEMNEMPILRSLAE